MKLTVLEIKFLSGIKETWSQTGAYCTYLEDVLDECEIPVKQARGIISSLIKKGIILECLPQYGNEINLTETGRVLLDVPECY